MRIPGRAGRLRRVEVRQTLGGRYTLLGQLGRGGMAVVWRAQDEVLGRPVAVKLLAGRHVGDPQSRARIRDEARAAATLSHPNIAQVYDYGEADEDGVARPYVVMELVNGPTLQQRVSDGPLPPRTAMRICGEVAAALAAAHADGLVHRDIKMANVMVTPNGAKVVDFGIAAAAGPAEPEEILVGTPAYLAPERLTGDQVVPASDVYALGVLLYRLLADESPWSVDSTTQMLRAHVHAEPAPLPELPGVPPAVAALIDRCLRKDPASRPSAAEVSAILGDAAEVTSPTDPVRRSAVVPQPRMPTGAAAGPLARPVPKKERNRRPAAAGRWRARLLGDDPRSRGWRIALIGTVLGLAIVGLGGWALNRESKVDSSAAAPGPTAPVESAATGAAPAELLLPPPLAAGQTRPPGTAPAGQAPPATTDPTAGPPAPQVSGSRSAPAPASPGSSAGADPTPSTAGPGDPRGSRLTSPGGEVVALCDQGKVTMTSWQPASGYTVEKVQPGPALTAVIVFKSTLLRYRMTVTCVAGNPTPVVLPV